MVSRIFKITVLGLLISMGMASPSHAQFEMNGAEKGATVESIPFVVALRKIVPIDYDFSFETDVDLGQVVSYNYMDSWDDTLSALLINMEMSYRIDNSVIYIAEVKSAPSVAKVSAPAKPVAAQLPVMVEQANVQVAAEVIEATPEVVYIWKVRKGFTLQETIKSWGEQAGWTVIWDSDRDFNIQSEVSFSGSFVDAASDLIGAFEEADPPVIGTFYKNNTLVVETTSNGEVN